MNRCFYCGKFRKLEDLIWGSMPDSYYGDNHSEDTWYECKPGKGCNKKHENPELMAELNK
jgi:hypothetical protein